MKSLESLDSLYFHSRNDLQCLESVDSLNFHSRNSLLVLGSLWKLVVPPPPIHTQMHKCNCRCWKPKPSPPSSRSNKPVLLGESLSYLGSLSCLSLSFFLCLDVAVLSVSLCLSLCLSLSRCVFLCLYPCLSLCASLCLSLFSLCI